VRRRGGNCPNTLEVLQQLIIESKKKRQQQQKILAFPDLVLIAVLPAASSPASQFIRDSLAPAVDLTHCIYREEFTEPASSYIIKSRTTGSRTIVNYNELPELTAAEFGAAAERLDLGDGSARWFHFEVCSSTLAPLYLRKGGCEMFVPGGYLTTPLRAASPT